MLADIKTYFGKTQGCLKYLKIYFIKTYSKIYCTKILKLLLTSDSLKYLKINRN